MRVHLAVLTVLAAAAPSGAAVAPVAVSPGDVSEVVRVEDRCPTFSWGAVSGAMGYELVVYRVGDEAEPVLRQRISGSALGWTPPLGRCLDRGGRYAWAVRALARKGGSQWSSPALFEVAVGPSRAEVETALQVLGQYVAARRDVGAKLVAEAGAEPESEPGKEAAASAQVPRAVGTAELTVDGGVVATSFTGDGSTLTSLDASHLASGTVPSGVLSGTYSGGLSFPNVTSTTVANATVSSSLGLSGATVTLTGASMNGGTFASGTFSGGAFTDGGSFSGSFAGGSFTGGSFTGGSYSGTHSGDGSGLTGVGKYLEAAPLEGCHLVTDSSIKTVGVYCPDGSGGENLCVSNSNTAPFACSLLSDATCRAWCLDTSASTSTTSALSRIIIPSRGVLSTYLDRGLACHFKGSTLVRFEQKLVCDSGACIPGGTTELAERGTSFVGVTVPSTIWQILPGSSFGGTAAVAEAGNYLLRLTATMGTSAPYDSATCFLVNKINDDPAGGTDDNSRVRLVFDTPTDLYTW